MMPLWISFLVVWALSLFHYGAVAPWSVAATVAAIAVLNLIAMRRWPEPIKLSRGAVVFLWSALAVFVLQFLPLPFLVPHTTHLRELHDVGGLWPATADSFLTLRVFAQILAYALSALLVLKLRREGLTTATALKGIVIVLSLEAAYGLVQVFSGERLLPFYDGPTPAPHAATGSLVGRNTFAGLMAMGLVLAAALAYRGFLWPTRRTEEEEVTTARRLEAGLGWALAGGLFAVAIILSKSRGGTIAALSGLVLIPFLYKGRGSLGGLVAIVVVGLVAILVSNPSGLVARFEQIDPFEVTAEKRWDLWTTTLGAATRQPVLGFGIGTHPHAFHPFQPAEMTGQIHHAHNEYVNILFEGGVLWLGVLLFGLVYWFLRVRKGSRALHSPDRLPVAAVLAAVGVQVIHSIVDFDLRVTSIGILLGALIGLGSAACRTGTSPRKAAWAAPGVGLVASALFFFLPLDPEKLPAKSALALSPYHHAAAWTYAREAQKAGDVELTDKRFETAAMVFPAHPDVQLEAGIWFWEGYVESQRMVQRDRAQTCLARLFRQRPQDVESVLDEIWEPDLPIGDFEALIPPVPRAAAGLAAFLVEVGQWEEALRVFNVGCPAVPEAVPAYDHFARALHAAGQWGMEAQIRDRRLELQSDGRTYAAAATAWFRLGVHETALERVVTAMRIQPGDPRLYSLKGDILVAQEKRLDAVEAYTQAIRHAPRDTAYLMRRAQTYTDLDMHRAAADDYAAALRAKPDTRRTVILLARSLHLAEDVRGARQVLEKWLARHPEDLAAKRYLDSIKR